MTTAIALNFTDRNGVPVMSSLDLAALCVGDAKDAHSNFMKKAKKVLSETTLVNFYERETYGNNNTRDILMLPEREACLMAMSYSYELQAYVYDEWQKLKNNQVSLLPDFSDPVAAARAWADEVEAKQKALTVIEEQAPKVEYHDRVLDSTEGMLITTIAKELGYSGVKLNKLLQAEGIQYRVGGQWVLYAEHQDKNWTITETVTFDKPNGEVGTTHRTKWLEEGRKMIHSLIPSKKS